MPTALDFAALTDSQRAIMTAAFADTLPVKAPARCGRDIAALVKAGFIGVSTRIGGLFGAQNERQIAPTRAAWTAAREQRIAKLALVRDVETVSSWCEPADGRGWAVCWPNGSRFV